MAYTPTVWETGDTITAEKLNKMEEGIEDAGAGEGVQFYGPYKASASASVNANTAKMITLTDLENINGATVNYPQDTTAKLFLYGFCSGSTSGILSQEMWLPSVSDGLWNNGAMIVFNSTDSAVSDSVYMYFYSTAEFPLEV